MIILVTKHHFGVHQWNVKLKDFSGFLYVWCWSIDLRCNLQEFQWFWLAAFMYTLFIFLIKLAIVLQVRRIFVPLHARNATFWTCHGMIWLNFIAYSVLIFFHIFDCSPVHKFWNPWIKGRCFDFRIVEVISATFNMASDVSIIVLLQYVIWNLQMSLTKKIRVSAIFLVGIL